MKSIKNFAVVMILIAVISRLVPHPPNFTSLSAVALFSIHQTNKWWIGGLITLVSLWFSDLMINNIIIPYSYPTYYEGFRWFGGLWVYLGYSMIIAAAAFYLKKSSTSKILISGVFSAILFYLVTNFGVWYSGSLYPKNMEGLMMSYISGLPFLLNSVMGNLFFLGLFYGSKAYLEKYVNEKP